MGNPMRVIAVMIDIAEHDGSALGSHAAGEAAAEWDADAALHLLLDPDRRAGDEFIRLRVQQQHRACIHVEELAHPQEERGEQLFEFEMRKRGIRQCLEPAKTLRVLMPRHDRSLTIASTLRRVARGLTAHKCVNLGRSDEPSALVGRRTDGLARQNVHAVGHALGIS